MNDHSEIMEELWRIKQELSSGFKSFHDYFVDLLRRQAERFPELAKKASPTPACLAFAVGKEALAHHVDLNKVNG